ncbi:MAG: D-cysteine desulfhydrase family protein [candidate division NC10 bacterium]|nr:D-cysteine desulfhydrase family protein [candidate division NC10 bacterium]
MRLEEIPRHPLALLPTPLHELPRLSAAAGGVRIWIKRDDLTGFALGGNKVRKLEFLLADALRQGADTLLTAGGLQSNHARVTAAAAAAAGLECHLVLSGGRPERLQGNTALDALLGATLHFVPTGPERTARLSALAEELRRAGRKPYVIPIGGSVPVGALGYVLALEEVQEECVRRGLRPEAIVVATSSGGTQGGLEAGKRLVGWDVRIIGVSNDEPAAFLQEASAELATVALALLGRRETVRPEELTVLGEYIGEGYGTPTPASQEALALFAKTEGIILDPTYTAKAAAGLLDLIHREEFRRGQAVLFWHTGGLPPVLPV